MREGLGRGARAALMTACLQCQVVSDVTEVRMAARMQANTPWTPIDRTPKGHSTLKILCKWPTLGRMGSSFCVLVVLCIVHGGAALGAMTGVSNGQKGSKRPPRIQNTCSLSRRGRSGVAWAQLAQGRAVGGITNVGAPLFLVRHISVL